MRTLLLLAFSLVLMSPHVAQRVKAAEDEPATEKRRPRETVEFDGNTLPLAWENTTDLEHVKEYIPSDQRLEHWTVLASIREFPAIGDVKVMVGGMVKELKKTYPQSPMSLLENPQTGDAMIDFVVWPPDGSFVEFNVFRYRKNPAGGIVAQQYALHNYDNPQEFLKSLRPLRERLVNLMAANGLTLSAITSDEDRAD